MDPAGLNSHTSTDSFTESIIGRPFDASRCIEQLFERCKNDNLREGVVYVDARMRVTFWNRAAEGITGIRATAMLEKNWLPSQIDLHDRYGFPISDPKCPVKEAITSAERKLIAASVTGRGGRKIAIDLHAIPVMDHDEQVYGAVIFMHDLTSQVDLEQQVLTLYAHATRDQLTGVANRTHFERTLDARVSEFQDKGTVCSLIVADIDFFKTINDDFGHHVGDQALVTFAKLIQQNTRVDDVVARFGGEEFVVLCPACTVEEAANRAEEIREMLENTPLAVLDGKCLTASFGVCQIREADSATTVFVRADQALLTAKENGRNQVITYDNEEAREERPRETEKAVREITKQPEWKSLKGKILACEEFATSSPLDLVVQKIRGFVIDVGGQVLKAEDDYLQIRIDKLPGEKLRRFGDRPSQVLMDVELQYSKSIVSGQATLIRVTLRPGRMRDRRRSDLTDRAHAVLRELRGFLMVSPSSSLPDRLEPTDQTRYGSS